MCMWCKHKLMDHNAERVLSDAPGEGPAAAGHAGTVRSGGDGPVTASSVDIYGRQTPGLPAVPRSIVSPLGRSVGSTYSMPVTPQRSTFIPAPTNHDANMNQAEAGNPHTSRWGQDVIRHEGTIGTPAAGAGLMNFARPLATYTHGAHEYDGFLGVTVFVSALQRALVGGAGYPGIAPIRLQPLVDKPWPFNTGSIGASTG